MGDIVGIYDGVHQTPNYQNSGVMFLSVENIATLKSSKFISEEDFKRDYKVFPQENDILMTRIGDVGTTNVVTDNGLKAYYVSLALLKYKSTDPYFLSNAIQSDYVQKGLANRTLKTAIPMKINKDEIGKVSVMLPLSATEQQQIGTYFANLDNLITLHQRKYNKLLNVKKSMLEKMFPKNESNIPEIRFKGFADPWEQRKLGDISESYSGGTPTAGKKEYYNGDIPFIRSGEISGDKTELFITDEGLNNSSAKMVQIGYILYALYGATSGEVSISKLKGAINQAVLAIQPHQNYDSQFLMQWLRKSKDNIIGTYLQGGQGNLSGNIVKELIVDVPTYEEQKEIGAYFQQLDNLITLHQREWKGKRLWIIINCLLNTIKNG